MSTVAPRRTTFRSFLRLAALSAACTFAGAACAWEWGGPGITGSGKAGSETRAVSGFDAVSLRGSFKVVLRMAGREGVSLQGDDNLLPLVETRVVDGHTLELRWKPGTSVRERAEIVVTVDAIKLQRLGISGSGSMTGDGLATPSLAVAVSGSGDVTLHTLQTEALSASISGSGDVAASGRATRLEVAVSGSGDVDAQRLESDDVAIRLAGSGDASVQARRSLRVSIAGSGDVVYGGDAHPEVQIAGSGTVKHR